MTAKSANRNAAALLALVATLCAAIVAVTYQLTADRITANQRQYLAESLKPALAGIEYDNDLSSSVQAISAPGELPGRGEATLYLATHSGAPAAWLFVVEALDGYSGPIRLLIGIAPHGGITAVRVLEHRETPGLGDGIDIARSRWIEQFSGRSLTNPDPPGWNIRRDGGEFDQFTGASVTPRAVVRAVSQTLAFFAAHRETLPQPGDSQKEQP